MTSDDGAASRKRIDALKTLTSADFAVWAHYEDRADQLGQELWSVGSWLLALLGATLSLPFIADFIQSMPAYPYFRLANRMGVGVVGAFGLFLCIYFYFAMSDVREHIESNWRKAGYVLEGTWQADWKGRKNHGWIMLLVIGWLAVAAFVCLFLAAFLWP